VEWRRWTEADRRCARSRGRSVAAGVRAHVARLAQKSDLQAQTSAILREGGKLGRMLGSLQKLEREEVHVDGGEARYGVLS
jgi:hypothetical protein